MAYDLLNSWQYGVHNDGVFYVGGYGTWQPEEGPRVTMTPHVGIIDIRTGKTWISYCVFPQPKE